MKPRPLLHEYIEKRDFGKTPEPAGGDETDREGPLTFAVQKHDATRLHYDLRLELDGVLKSWAVPNGPSLKLGDKRLAVMTEDHPLMYTRFEGVIPRGNYGAGEMIVWDRGVYAPEKGLSATRAEQEELLHAEIERGRLTIALNGQKLKGLFTLVRTSRSPRDWLLMKKDDGFASDRDVLADERSAISGLTIDDLKIGRRPAQHSVATFADRLEATAAAPAPMPGAIEPMGASLTENPFSHPRWLFEAKLDGYRVIAFVRGAAARLQSRRGIDNTKEYGWLVAELAKQGHEMVLDGEIVALDESGRPSFDLLKERLSDNRRQRGGAGLLYYVFDLLYCDGRDLRAVPLIERKSLLTEALVQTPAVRLVEYVEEDGRSFFEAVKQLGLEGMVAKLRDSSYESRRSQSWLKVKSTHGDEFVIGGYTIGEGNRADTFGALVLGQYDTDGKLRYVGNVGTGFDDRMLTEIRRTLDLIAADHSPFDEKVVLLKNRPIVWLRPEMVAEVTFVEMTKENRVRAPVFVRLRSDKAAVDARRVEVVAPPLAETRAESLGVPDDIAGVLEQLADAPAKGTTLAIGEARLSLTSLDREYWPGVTKRDLLRYLALVSPHALPHLKDRPLTLIRYPDGIDGERFYQKHWEKAKPDFVDEVIVYSDHNVGDEHLCIVNNLASLLWLGQMGALEFHSWYSRTVPEPDGARGGRNFSGSLERMRNSLLNYPDFVVFDLDPVRPEGQSEPKFEREKFKRVSDAALWLRELLDTLSLSTFVKTTGRSGMHVFVPIKRTLDFDEARAVSQTVAQFLKAQHPGEITLEFAVKRRVGDVFVDTNQNVRGKTLVSIYSPRATPGATVATPLRWDEVGKVVPGDFTIATLPDRLARVGDLWTSIHADKGDLDKAFGIAAG